MLYPMNYGMVANQMSSISECGDRLHMCIFKRTSAVHCTHIMRNVYLLDTQMATRAGSSITWLQSTPLSLNALILTSALQSLCPHPFCHMGKLLHLLIQHLTLRIFQKTTLWMLLGFCILGGHLILLETRIQNPTPHLQCLDHSQMLLRLHLLYLSLCRPLLALVHACLEKSASDLKNGGNSVQHSSSTMTWMTLMTKKQILPIVLPPIQHILGHLEMPWSKMMLWSGDKLLWMNWLPIRQMGHGLLLIDLRINQSLDQSGSLSRNIMLMAPLSTRGLLGCTGLLSASLIQISQGICSNSAPTHSTHHPCTRSHPRPPSLVCWCLKCISQWQNELWCLYGAAKGFWIGRLQEDSVFAQKSAIWYQTRWKQVESQDAHHFQVLGLQTDIFWYCCLYFCLRWCPDHPACLCG